MRLRLTLSLAALLLASLPAHAQSPALVESRALNAEGMRLIAAGQWNEAQAVLQRALPLCASAAPFVANCTSAVLANLAVIRDRHGDAAAALDLAQRSVAAAEATVPPDKPWLVFRYRTLAVLHYKAGQHVKAEALLRHAIALAEGDVRVPPQSLGECLLSLLGPLINQGRMAEAVEAGMRGIALLRPNGLASADRYADHMVGIANIAIALTALQRDAEAETVLGEALRLPPPGGNAADPNRLRLVVFLADALRRQGRHAGAEQAYREVAALWHARPDPARIHAHLDALVGLAILLQETGRDLHAEPLWRQAQALAEQHLPPTHASRLDAANNFGAYLLRRRRLDEAAAILEAALTAQEAQAPRPTSFLAYTLFQLAETRKAQQRLDEAAALLARAAAAYAAIGQADSATALDVVATQAELAIIGGTEADAVPLLRDALRRTVAARGDATQEYARRARAYGTALLATGDAEGAEQHLRRALAVHGATARPSAFTLHVGVDLARTLDALARPAEAQALFDETAASAADVLSDPQAAARLLIGIGDHYIQTARLDQAVAIYRRAMDLLAADQAQDSWPYVEAQDGLAAAALRRGDLATAEHAARDSLARAMRLAGPGDMLRAWRHERLAWVLSEASLHAEAEAEHKRAIAIATQGQAESTLAIFLHQLGIFYQETGRLAEARPLYEQALAIDRRISPAETERTATYVTAIAALLRRDGDLAGAEALVLQGLAIRTRLFAPTHLHVSESLNALGLVRAAQGRPAEAEAPYRRALAIRQLQLGPRARLVAVARLNLADALLDLGRTAEAKGHAEAAASLLATMFGPAHPQAQPAVPYLARIATLEGRPADAADQLAQAHAVLAAAYGSASPFLAANLEDRAALALHRGRIAEAERWATEALAIRETAQPATPDHPSHATALALLAHARLAQGDPKAAEALQRRVLAIRTRQSGPGGAPLAALLHDLATVLLAQEHLPEAAALARKAQDALAQATGAGPGPALDLATLQARIAAAEGRWNEAASELQEILQARRRLTGPRHPKVADLLEAIGRIAIARGHYAEAETTLVEVQSILVALHGSGDVATTSASLALADLADARRNVAQAMAIRSRVLALRQDAAGAATPALAFLQAALAYDHARLGETEAARSALAQATHLAAQAGMPRPVAAQLANAEALVALAEGAPDRAEQALETLARLDAAHPAPPPDLAVARLNNLALVQLRQGRAAQAEQTFRHALAQGEANLGPDHPRLATVLLNLADLAARDNRPVEAARALARATALLVKAGLPSAPAERWL